MAMAVGAASACSDDDGSDVPANAGTGAGTAGSAGSGGAAGTGGAAGASGGGAGGATPAPPPDPALPANAPTLACPAVINGALEATDPTQTGRHSRIAPISACGEEKAYPGNDADPTNPHLFDVYRFANPTSAPVCFSLTLSDGGVTAADAGALDAGSDAAAPSGPESVLDAGGDASAEAPAAGPERYLAAYGTFYPSNIGLEFLGDVGDDLAAPQTMGITVPAGETIDVVVYGVLNAPLGVGSYTLSCSAQ